MEQRCLLSAQSLSCIRQELILFEQLSFDVCVGDILQIKGINGSGKTSLLRILSGLSLPYSGNVAFYQKPDIDYNNILYIGHLSGIKHELSAYQNLDFYSHLHGQRSYDLHTALTQVDLDGCGDLPAGYLSAGQQRRNTLARLVDSQHRIWILDEPFTSLDQTGVIQLEQLLLRHAEQGGCVIFTTHQPLDIEHYEQFRILTLYE